CQVLGIDVPGLPERHGQLRAGLDLLRQHPDVAVFHAELIVAGAPLGVLLPHRLVAERFELLERFIEGHGRDTSQGESHPGARSLPGGITQELSSGSRAERQRTHEEPGLRPPSAAASGSAVPPPRAGSTPNCRSESSMSTYGAIRTILPWRMVNTTHSGSRT